MKEEYRDGRKLKSHLAQMRQRLDELQASMAEHPRPEEIERLLSDLREANERLVMASLEQHDRAVAAELLEETERRRLEAILKLTRAGVIIVEAPSGAMVLHNDQVEQIWRSPFPASADAGFPENQVFHLNGRPYVLEEWPLVRSLRRGEVVKDEKISFLRGDGTRGIMLASSAPIQDRKGRIAAAAMVFYSS